MTSNLRFKVKLNPLSETLATVKLQKKLCGFWLTGYEVTTFSDQFHGTLAERIESAKKMLLDDHKAEEARQALEGTFEIEED